MPEFACKAWPETNHHIILVKFMIIDFNQEYLPDQKLIIGSAKSACLILMCCRRGHRGSDGSHPPEPSRVAGLSIPRRVVPAARPGGGRVAGFYGSHRVGPGRTALALLAGSGHGTASVGPPCGRRRSRLSPPGGPRSHATSRRVPTLGSTVTAPVFASQLSHRAHGPRNSSPRYRSRSARRHPAVSA